MTTYVALSAVRDGRLTMDTPLTMSRRAARLPPSKMGFQPGTLVTLDNALKMLMVKSPNDVAWMIGEGISGSMDKFSAEMNAAASKLGMRESHFVNPNGLHDPDHYSSARDMAILARALLKEFPEHADLFDIGELQMGRMFIRNHNGLLGHYPGADGMKTGFTCPAGWNIVATADHDGRKLIVVIFGRPDAARAQRRGGNVVRSRLRDECDRLDAGFARRLRRDRAARHARRNLPRPRPRRRDGDGGGVRELGPGAGLRPGSGRARRRADARRADGPAAGGRRRRRPPRRCRCS